MGVNNLHFHIFTILRFGILGGGYNFVAKDCFLCFGFCVCFMDHQSLEEMMHLLMCAMLELNSTKAVAKVEAEAHGCKCNICKLAIMQ
jgi:hypothetical protein